MSNRNFILLTLGVIAVLGSGYFIWFFNSPENNTDSTTVNPLVEAATPIPLFMWRFLEAETKNPDGGPQTNIYLSAVYNGTSTREKLIDTVDGGCSEIEGVKHEGDVSNTGKVQCYYAGLGQSYRIVKGESSYRVEKKFWEEAMPEVEPTEEQWEYIAEFYIY